MGEPSGGGRSPPLDKHNKLKVKCRKIGSPAIIPGGTAVFLLMIWKIQLKNQTFPPQKSH